jgi:hypothetical protein
MKARNSCVIRKVFARAIVCHQQPAGKPPLQAGLQALRNGLTVHYYDGAPQLGGKVFAVHHTPYLGPNATLEYRAPFTSDSCGPHKIFVVAGQGSRHETVGLFSRPMVVECSR